ncbi:MAG: hypothetical protein IKU52_00380 [Clostridia bacterium]|nr:hypothetical protein [Clostridia bacterium]
MKKLNLICICICIILVFCSCAFDDERKYLTPPDTIIIDKETEPKSVATPQDAAYETSVTLLKQKNSFTQTLTVNTVYDNNGIITEEASRKISVFENLQNDSFHAETFTEYTYEDTTLKKTESYSNGTLTKSFPGEESQVFSSNCSKDKFLKDNDPYLLLKRKLYSSVEFEDECTLLFTDASGFEKWVGFDNYSFVFANAILSLNADNEIIQIEYSAKATNNGTTAQINAIIVYDYSKKG